MTITTLIQTFVTKAILLVSGLNWNCSPSAISTSNVELTQPVGQLCMDGWLVQGVVLDHCFSTSMLGCFCTSIAFCIEKLCVGWGTWLKAYFSIVHCWNYVLKGVVLNSVLNGVDHCSVAKSCVVCSAKYWTLYFSCVEQCWTVLPSRV